MRNNFYIWNENKANSNAEVIRYEPNLYRFVRNALPSLLVYELWKRVKHPNWYFWNTI